eukprot:gene8241-14184_t
MSLFIVSYFIMSDHYSEFLEPKLKQETNAVVIGYHIAIEECQSRFKWNRWNCTLPKALLTATRPISLTKSMPHANRETAYMYSMVAAGITYSLMKSCSEGRNNRCPCVVENMRSNRTQRTCKENLAYAFKRAKRVMKQMEVKEVPKIERRQFNIKNFKTGIKTIQKELPEVCHCYGLSGTCSKKLCWKSMPNIVKVSEKLRKLYDDAVEVHYDTEKRSLVRTVPHKQGISLRNTEMVFLEPSPNYCHPLLTGHKGTLLRHCDPDNPKTCEHLCEGCGYRTVKRVVYEKNCNKCRKHFEWCCSVFCGKCHVTKAQCRLRPA